MEQEEESPFADIDSRESSLAEGDPQPTAAERRIPCTASSSSCALEDTGSVAAPPVPAPVPAPAATAPAKGLEPPEGTAEEAGEDISAAVEAGTRKATEGYSAASGEQAPEAGGENGVGKPGGERDLVQAGSTSALKPSSKVASNSRNDDLRKALVGFYSVHNPGRIANLDVILAQYDGKEELLIERLERKYSADLSYARRAASAPRVAPAPKLAGGTSHASTGDDQTHLPSRPPQQQKKHHHRPPQRQQPAEQLYQREQTLGHSSSTAAAAYPTQSRHTPPRPTGSPLSSENTAASTAASASSSYITYLADQIRSNVEGFLPVSSSGGGGGGSSGSGSWGVAGGGSTAYHGSYVPSAAVVEIDHHVQAAESEAVAATSAVGLRGVGGPGTTMIAGTSGNGSGSGDGGGGRTGYQHEVYSVGGAGDPALVARLRILEEERAGLLAACRRMQAKAEAAAREVAAAEELREAGQRKIAGFAERAAAAEKQAREASARLRALESGQAALRAEKEISERRCGVKHSQLISTIGVQFSLRSQLEGLLEVVPPSPPSAPPLKPRCGIKTATLASPATSSASVSTATEAASEGPVPAGSMLAGSGAEDGRAANASYDTETRRGNVAQEEGRGVGVCGGNVDGEIDVEVEGGGGGGGGGIEEDERRGEDVDETKRRFSAVEVSLRASRKEALEARRARDAAESTVRQQREDLTRLKERVSELEASLEREQEAGKGASQAASGLETELDIRLGHLRRAEAELSDQLEVNFRLREELSLVSARLGTAAAARAALVGFCQQERTAVEALAAEQAVRVEENSAMRGEEGLARGLELARLAEERGSRKVAGLGLEVERLGKALLACRAQLAGSEARAQGLRRELERAAEIIASSATVTARGGGGGVEGGGELSPTAERGQRGRHPSSSAEYSGGLTEEEALLIRHPATAGSSDAGVVATTRVVGELGTRSDSRGGKGPPTAERSSVVGKGGESETAGSLHPGGGTSAIAGYDVEL